LPDNFSDVVPISANVSRRGSPSLSGSKLSGRETPFSNHAEQNNGFLIFFIKKIFLQILQ